MSQNSENLKPIPSEEIVSSLLTKFEMENREVKINREIVIFVVFFDII